jgi:hypothetical protein
VRRPQLKVLPYNWDPNFHWVVDLRGFGKGRRFFRTKADAEAFAEQQRSMLSKHGREVLDLSKKELAEIVECKNRLAAHGKTIRDATDFFLAHLPARKH